MQCFRTHFLSFCNLKYFHFFLFLRFICRSFYRVYSLLSEQCATYPKMFWAFGPITLILYGR